VKGREGGSINFWKMFMGICPYLPHLLHNSSCWELEERRIDHRIATGMKRPTWRLSLSYDYRRGKVIMEYSVPSFKGQGGVGHVSSRSEVIKSCLFVARERTWSEAELLS